MKINVMREELSAQLDLEVQYVSDADDTPAQHQLRQWACAAMVQGDPRNELVIRIVDEPEIRDLNRRYRDQDKATNVLSFQSETLPGLDNVHIGDLVICAPVVTQEARQQDKTLSEHWAHLVVHGVLHLRGFDHQTDQHAQEMEAMEVEILRGMGFGNPYRQAPEKKYVTERR